MVTEIENFGFLAEKPIIEIFDGMGTTIKKRNEFDRNYILIVCIAENTRFTELKIREKLKLINDYFDSNLRLNDTLFELDINAW